jgi:hypothetical protein
LSAEALGIDAFKQPGTEAAVHLDATPNSQSDPSCAVSPLGDLGALGDLGVETPRSRLSEAGLSDMHVM